MSKPKQQTPGEVVARLRAEKGWTRYRLSRASGVDQHTVRAVEEGRTGCTLETARKLAAALGASLAAFD